MKKFYLSIILLSIQLSLSAQGIHQFWGLASLGGDSDEGALFSTKYDGTNIKRRDAFEIYASGKNPDDQRMTAFNGKLYGMMPNAGPYNNGIIYEYNPATNTYTTRIRFFDQGIGDPRGQMVLMNNKLYGIVGHSSFSAGGILFEYNPVNNAFVKKYELDHYVAGLCAFNNKLYGTTHLGGVNDEGIIFSFEPTGNVFTKQVDLTFNNNRIVGALQVFNNKLYGVTNSGGLSGKGSVVEFNPANNVITTKADLASMGGAWPTEGLTLFNNKFYGSTSWKLFEEVGVLYEYDPVQNTITKKMDLSEATGLNISSPFTVYNNKLYGTTQGGGIDGNGLLFEYDPATNVYTKKVYFSEQNGTNPRASMTVLNNKLYGLASFGGAGDGGTLFEYNPAINGLAKKIDLNKSNGLKPHGKLTYYQGKLYGITSLGGDHNDGVIFSYDLATHTYAVRHHMQMDAGQTDVQGGMLLYNNKFYGVARYYTNNYGCIYEFDPATDTYTVRHLFTGTGGQYPIGLPVVLNNKFYGTTAQGGNTDNGTIYEFDPATNNCTVKVNLGGAFGGNPVAGLTAYNGKLYGATTNSGNFDAGTLFEYIPGVNGFIVRHHFKVGEGHRPSSSMIVHNDKLYGTTDFGDVDNNNPGTFWGTLYEFNPATNVFTTKHKFTYPGGGYPRNALLSHRNKLYGMTGGGGPLSYGGTVYEYDPVFNNWSQQDVFTNDNGRFPEMSQLIAIPALVAPGSPGSCINAGTTMINTTNSTEWVPFTDEEGNAVAEINANGNILGNVTVRFYTHDGDTRKDQQGRFYLDRNITVLVDNQPTTPVSIRLYIRKTEFESLKNTPGSGILNVSDITIFKNDDACADAVASLAKPVTSSVTTWGLDYVFTADISSFSSFYFASKAHSALPVKLAYFKGETKASSNWLYWKASCTENTDFMVERSADGVQFTQIGLVPAIPANCDHPFEFPDQHPIEGKAWYRLQMKESSGAVSYSNMIMLQRGQANVLSIQLTPNPVTGAQAIVRIYSPDNKMMPVQVYDGMGRLVIRTQLAVQKGAQAKTIDVTKLPAGVYHAIFHDGQSKQSIRFLRQ